MKIKFDFSTDVNWDRMVKSYLFLRQMNSVTSESFEGGLKCTFERPMPDLVKKFYPLLKFITLEETAEYDASTKTMRVVNKTETTRSEYTYQENGAGGTLITGFVKIPTILVAGFKPFVKQLVRTAFRDDKVEEVNQAHSMS